jgi:hypothetical protein
MLHTQGATMTDLRISSDFALPAEAVTETFATMTGNAEI